ncbi:hypothetical protein [Cupriavidus sp. TMH.W2]|uniref:hypothetical protein n=1 Tax=Cupriavidus sp. TMH.W2 TaxID=3434465 RepID=UPI003D77FF75
MKLQTYRPMTTIELPNEHLAVLPVFVAHMEDHRLFSYEDGYVVGVLLQDAHAMATNPAANRRDFGQLTEFRSTDALNAYLVAEQEAGHLAYRVDRYAQGNLRYSVSESIAYTEHERMWFVAPSAVYVPGEATQIAFANRRAEIAAQLDASDPDRRLNRVKAAERARAELVDTANARLKDYSAWCNREVFGYSLFRCNAYGNPEGTPVERWGIFGRDEAERAMGAALQRATAPQVDMQVGFVNCAQSDVGMLDAYGFRYGRYLVEAGGVWAAITQEHYAQAVEDLGVLATDFRLQLTPYLCTDADLVAAEGTNDPLGRRDARRRAQLAWASWHATRAEDPVSQVFWRDRYHAVRDTDHGLQSWHTYSLRAECERDIEMLHTALRATPAVPQHWRTEPCSLGVDVKLEFQSRASLAELRQIAGGVPDGHVMVETLRHCPMAANSWEREVPQAPRRGAPAEGPALA